MLPLVIKNVNLKQIKTCPQSAIVYGCIPTQYAQPIVVKPCSLFQIYHSIILTMVKAVCSALSLGLSTLWPQVHRPHQPQLHPY